MRIPRRHISVAAIIVGAVVLGAAGAVALALGSGAFSDDAPKHVVDFTQITPLPFNGYPATVTQPNYNNPPHCQLPEDERLSPGLPPLSCRNSGSEPPPNTIPTADPAKRAPTPTADKGFKVIDNALFRYTLLVPDTWYSNMRAEGGEFEISDPQAVGEFSTHLNAPGGVELHFSAMVWSTALTPVVSESVLQQRLRTPNARFGEYVGATWDDGPGEGLAHSFFGAFVKDGVLYEIQANIEDDGRSTPEIDADLARVTQILASIAPY
jgi:hypothetical protein